MLPCCRVQVVQSNRRRPVRKVHSDPVFRNQAYPTSSILDFIPDALGRSTRAGVEGASNPDAWDARYFPNGTLAHFSYGNGVRHDLTLNARGLADRSRDHDNSGLTVHDDSYDYDVEGNVVAISDGRTSAERGGRPIGDRTMSYDNLGRLVAVQSPLYAGVADNTVTYQYDVLDNLTHVVAPGRDLSYCYDEHWRLTNLASGGCTGPSMEGLGYDAQGNVANHNGTSYDFDFGNRLRSVVYAGGAVESYRYDGLGRRVFASSPAGEILSQYSRDGQLLYQSNSRNGTATE
jgi:YD repeat-containing protein